MFGRPWRLNARHFTPLLITPVLSVAFWPVAAKAAPPPERPPHPGSPDWFRNEPARGPAQQAQFAPGQSGPIDLQAGGAATPAPATPQAPAAPAPQTALADAGDTGGPAASAPAAQPGAPAGQGGDMNAAAGGGERPRTDVAPRRPYYSSPRLPGSFYPMSAASGGSYGPYDFPSAQLNNYASAFARAVTARAMFRRAESELNLAFTDFERRFDNSPEMRQAVADERAAYESLNRARRKSLQSIINDEHYVRLTALYQDLADRLNQGRATHSISADEVMAMAQLKLKYASDLHAMEADTLNADASVREAQDRLVAAGSRVAALRQRHDDVRRSDPDLLTARRNVEDARVAQLAADAYLVGQAIAAGEGLDGYYWARTPYRGYFPNTVYSGGYGGYAGY
jgi:hypothetical protein